MGRGFIDISTHFIESPFLQGDPGEGCEQRGGGSEKDKSFTCRKEEEEEIWLKGSIFNIQPPLSPDIPSIMGRQ